MKTRRSPVPFAMLLVALSLAACGSKQSASQQTTQQSERNDLALPVTAPMQARAMLLRETKKAKDAARARKKQLDSVINGGR